MRLFERFIALLPWCSSVCLSARLSGTGVHCDRRVQVSVLLSLRLDSPVFWAPWQQSMSTYSQPFFSSYTWKRDVVWINANYSRYDISRTVEWVCMVQRPTRHIIGHFGDDFYRPDDQTNSVKALKETSWSSKIRLESHQNHSIMLQ